MLDGNDSKWKYKFSQRRSAVIIHMECCQPGKHTQALMSKHVIMVLLHRNGRLPARLTLVSSPSRGWGDNHITLSPTVNHIVILWCSLNPPGKQTLISGRVFQRLRDHLTGAKEKARTLSEQD